MRADVVVSANAQVRAAGDQDPGVGRWRKEPRAGRGYVLHATGAQPFTAEEALSLPGEQVWIKKRLDRERLGLGQGLQDVVDFFAFEREGPHGIGGRVAATGGAWRGSLVL